MINWIKRKFLFMYKYIGKWISRYINQRKRADNKYKILIYCESSIMEEHLLNYMEQLEGEKYDFYISFGWGYPDGMQHPLENTLFQNKSVAVIKHYGQLVLQCWDLIVCADFEYPFWMFKGTIPTLYIGHGISNISYDNGENVFDYGPECYNENGEILFDKMLEPNSRVASIMKEKDKRFENVIVHTGYRFAGRIKEESEKSDFYKEQLGIPDGKTVVSFFGSWNKESLFHVLGRELFDACDQLKEKYVFIFSAHPNEYKRYSEDVEPMGKWVDQQRENGCIVRSPGEDWIPYIMASDVVVSDYSTMMSLAILAGKKVILTDFPDTKIGIYSLGYQVKKQFPVLSKAEDLEEALGQVLHVPTFEQMVEKYRQELYVTSEEYRKIVQSVTKEMVNRR